MKTLQEAKIIARSSDPDWLGEELFRLQSHAVSFAKALRAICNDSDWCPVCDCHPSHGHANGCLLEIYS